MPCEESNKKTVRGHILRLTRGGGEAGGKRVEVAAKFSLLHLQHRLLCGRHARHDLADGQRPALRGASPITHQWTTPHSRGRSGLTLTSSFSRSLGRAKGGSGPHFVELHLGGQCPPVLRHLGVQARHPA